MAKEEIKITAEEAHERTSEWIEEAEKSTKNNDPKHIIIETVKGIIQDYKELMKNSNDEMLLKGFADVSRSEEECINYVMNNLVKNNIYGGRDILMYPYIHD